MENATAEKIEVKQTKCRLGETLIYHPTNLKQLSSTPPVMPNGPIVNLIPRHVTTNVKHEKHILSSLKSKEPKFIPYEPYKAAVNPIIPYEKKNRRLQKSNVNVNMAVSRVAAMKLHETKVSNDLKTVDEDKSAESDWLIEKKAYEAEIQKLKEENSQLENQLKFQAQVLMLLITKVIILYHTFFFFTIG